MLAPKRIGLRNNKDASSASQTESMSTLEYLRVASNSKNADVVVNASAGSVLNEHSSVNPVPVVDSDVL